MATRVLAEQLHSIEDILTLTDADVIAALDINARTLQRWRQEETFPQHEARALLARMDALIQALTETFTQPATVRTWMRAPSRYLAGLTPAEVIRAGRLDRAEAALEALASGAFV